MTAFILFALGAVAWFVWRSSAPIRAGGWRVGAGLTSAVLIVVGVLLAVRGEEWIGLALAAGGLVMAFAGRVGRGATLGGARSGAFQSGRARPGQGRRPNLREVMSPAEARSILGVSEDATPAEIKAAYMRLMKRIHPDQGGTAGLASKLNSARETLLKR